MPKKSTDAEAALQKLGQRLRAGMAEQQPAQHLEAVRSAVREQYEQEQAAARTRKPAPNAAKEPERKLPEPDQER